MQFSLYLCEIDERILPLPLIIVKIDQILI